MLSLIVVASVFAACAGKSGKNTTTQSLPVITEEVIPTEKAKIKDNEAISYIEQAYTKEELGLDKAPDKYTFMVSTSGTEIDGDMYIQVKAVIMTQIDTKDKSDKATFTTEVLGEYYISYDGSKVLSKDMQTGDYKKLENRTDKYFNKGDGKDDKKEEKKDDKD
jgi:hypothetical protein